MEGVSGKTVPHSGKGQKTTKDLQDSLSLFHQKSMVSHILIPMLKLSQAEAHGSRIVS